MQRLRLMALGSLWTACACPCPPARVHTALDGGVMGAPCSDSTQCAPPLLCGVSPSNASDFFSSRCTVDCSASSCPTGSVCLPQVDLARPDGGAVLTSACIPSCQTDADCQAGERAGTCWSGVWPVHAADAGTQVSVCQAVACDYYNPTCPGGYLCVDDATPGCCGPLCPMKEGVPLAGWCQRTAP